MSSLDVSTEHLESLRLYCGAAQLLCSQLHPAFTDLATVSLPASDNTIDDDIAAELNYATEQRIIDDFLIDITPSTNTVQLTEHNNSAGLSALPVDDEMPPEKTKRKLITPIAHHSRFVIQLRFNSEIPGWLTQTHSASDENALRIFTGLLTSYRQTLQLQIQYATLSMDSLTQLNSRSAMLTETARLCERYTVGLVMIHCRDFQHINQKFGNAQGDQAIAAIAAKLREATREEDVLCRFGGALFGVAFPIETHADARAVADKLQHKLSQSRFIDGAPDLTFNVGLASIEYDGQSSAMDRAHTLIERADEALSSAQQQSAATIADWLASDNIRQNHQVMSMGSIFTADTSTDYRNMQLLWDISSLIADEIDFERLLKQVIQRLSQSLEFIQAGLYGASEIHEKAFTYLIATDGTTLEVPFNEDNIPTVTKMLAVSACSENKLVHDYYDNQIIVVVPLGLDGADCFYLCANKTQFTLSRDTTVLLFGLTQQLGKALRRTRLEEALNRQLHEQKEALQNEVNSLRENLQSSSIVYQSDIMHRLMKLAHRAAATDTTVLINGESGTGKERMMHALHTLSSRQDKPLVIVDCGAIPETLIESELFGHMKGAFTGADKNMSGKISEANGGILVLDEIGELPLLMQSKLLRFVQEKHFTPVGSNKVVKVDVKIVAVTNRDLANEVRHGNFRQDLFYRLNVVTLKIPPLRERREDIPLLTKHFLNRFSKQFDIGRRYLSAEAMTNIQHYDWPGNIRELENTLMQAVLLADNDEISWDELNINLSTKELTHNPPSDKQASNPAPLKESVVVASSLTEANSNDFRDIESDTSPEQVMTDLNEALEKVLDEIYMQGRFVNAPLGKWLEHDVVLATLLASEENVKQTALRLNISLSTARRRVDGLEVTEMESLYLNRPAGWQNVITALSPLFSGSTIIPGGLQALKMELLKVLLNRPAASMTHLSEQLGVSEPTFYKLKKQLADQLS